MQQMAHSYGLIPTLTRELPAAVPAWIIAELFYKFHSFTLECGAFLATWYVFSWIVGLIAGRKSNP
jgi:hypothetical protein